MGFWNIRQSILPQAYREGKPGFVGILFIGGLSLYAIMSLMIR